MGDIPWTLTVLLGAVILGAAIAYGMWYTRRRSRFQKALTEAATKREYAQEEKDKADVHMPT